MAALAGFLNGFAGGAQQQKDRKQRERELSIMEANVGSGSGGGRERSVAPTAPRVNGGTPSSNPSTSEAYQTDDPVAMDIPNEGRAFLNTIAGPESNGQYNVRYTPRGGENFDGYDQHPRIYEDGPAGRSSAAGRYQFTAQTWDDTGGGNFSPENQDRRAWQLAQDRYKAYTGGNLLEQLQNGGATNDMIRSLAPTWAGFNGDTGPMIATYNDSLGRYGQTAQAQEQPNRPTSRGIIPRIRSNLTQ